MIKTLEIQKIIKTTIEEIAKTVEITEILRIVEIATLKIKEEIKDSI